MIGLLVPTVKRMTWYPRSSMNASLTDSFADVYGYRPLLPLCVVMSEPSSQRTERDSNQQVLDYVRDRLGDKTSPGQAILHLAKGGQIRRVEWRSIDDVDDIINQANGAIP